MSWLKAALISTVIVSVILVVSAGIALLSVLYPYEAGIGLVFLLVAVGAIMIKIGSQ